MPFRRFALMFVRRGLRIGEALALRRTDFGPDCRVLHVRRSIWRGREQEPKTSNATRAVDIPETLACVVRSYIAGISGYLFATAQGDLTTARCPSSPTRRETCWVPRVPALFALRGSERMVFQKTWNAIGWATRPKMLGTSIQSSKTMLHSVSAGLNAPG
jgi:integrase